MSFFKGSLFFCISLWRSIIRKIALREDVIVLLKISSRLKEELLLMLCLYTKRALGLNFYSFDAKYKVLLNFYDTCL